jgi:Na+/H+ antiporter NhaC
LYPSGGIIGAHLPSLAGAIIAGATFGDFIAPISDTTIASALSQKAKIGPTVRSRVKYIVPAFVVALIGFVVTAGSGSSQPLSSAITVAGSPQGLVMILVPVLIIYLFLKGKHLLYGLMMGLIAGIAIGLIFGLLTPGDLLSLDVENMTARSFIIDGINKAVGISFFTILLMGLVATLKASGLIDHLIAYASSKIKTPLNGEAWISGITGAAVLLITHSVVAVLMVAEFTNETGERVNIQPQRRANIMSMVVCVFPFLLPYFIPVILMSSMTNSGQEYGVEMVSPLACGLHNFVAWGLFLVVIISVLFGYGRRADNTVVTH